MWRWSVVVVGEMAGARHGRSRTKRELVVIVV
jgi:hypothetical protein